MLGFRVEGLKKGTIVRLNFLGVGFILLGFVLAWISTTWVHPMNPWLAGVLAVVNALWVGLGIVLRTVRGADETVMQ
ncbi:MAG: hypothetical protein KGH56_03900 [Patescibacteria group bacterium]|nr:hypothetical protein [Patescibacteria group bacterium]